MRDTIKRARDLINAQMEDFMQNGKINPVAGIFLMKNNMNYTEPAGSGLKAGQSAWRAGRPGEAAAEVSGRCSWERCDYN